MDRHTVNLIVLFVGCLLLGALLVSCGHSYQPPGADLWRAI
jgi:uncharacterized membrane protein